MTILHQLVGEGREDEVLELLPKLNYNDINQRDEDGNTALHLACERNFTEIAIALLEKGALRSYTNNKGKRAREMGIHDEKLKQYFSRMGHDTSSDRFADYSNEADGQVASDKTSECYVACRNGETREVKRLLENMSPEEIDKIQSNGSTALHVACFFNHFDIVKMLLEAGATRTLKNKHGCVPYEETKEPIIKALFKRIPGNNRFVGDSGKIEWILVTPYVRETAAAEHHALKFYAKSSLQELSTRVKQYYLSTELKNVDKVDQVMYFFEQAIEKDDPEYIIRAYTAETGFYSRLNRDLAGGATTGQHERQYVVGIMIHHPAFEKYTYIGNAYRGMKMTDEDLECYTVGSSIMTKSFLSTTKDKKTAESFAQGTTVRANQSGNILKFPAFCTYIIRNRRTALAIEDVSEYDDEKEILIMPYAVFSVKAVKRPSNASVNGVVNITLEECQPFEEQ